MNPKNQKRFLTELTEPPQAIAKDRALELMEIIEGIETGKLEWTQTKWHCETAHCIAGWIEVREMERLGYNPYFDKIGNYTGADGTLLDLEGYGAKLYSPIVAPYQMLIHPTYEFAMDWLDINRLEADLLFDFCTSLEMQKELAKLLWHGYRFYLRDGSESFKYVPDPNDRGEDQRYIPAIATHFDNCDSETAFIYPDNLIDFCTLTLEAVCPTP